MPHHGQRDEASLVFVCLLRAWLLYRRARALLSAGILPFRKGKKPFWK
jgi:hypothetical protein